MVPAPGDDDLNIFSVYALQKPGRYLAIWQIRGNLGAGGAGGSLCRCCVSSMVGALPEFQNKSLAFYYVAARTGCWRHPLQRNPESVPASRWAGGWLAG